MVENSNSSFFCSQCGQSIARGSRFCSECGAKLDKRTIPSIKLSPLTVLVFFLLSAGTFGIAWSAQSSLGGERPTEHFSRTAAAPASQASSGAKGMPDMPKSTDPVLVELRTTAEEQNTEISWMNLVNSLLVKMEESNEPRLELVFEAIGALGNVLEISPENQTALLTMADLSFSHQAFDKALSFYQRYLALIPEDNSARARYASTLTFLGSHDQAVKELETVLNSEPKNFHALAYLAIAHSQSGDQNKAMEVGLVALEAAPNQEAKDRFSNFLDSLVKKDR